KEDLPELNVFVARADLEDEYISAFTLNEALDALTGSGIFTEHFILKQCGVSDVTSLTKAHLRDFCGNNKRKVNCAIAIAQAITPRHIQKMNGVRCVVDFLRSR